MANSTGIVTVRDVPFQLETCTAECRTYRPIRSSRHSGFGVIIGEPIAQDDRQILEQEYRYLEEVVLFAQSDYPSLRRHPGPRHIRIFSATVRATLQPATPGPRLIRVLCPTVRATFRTTGGDSGQLGDIHPSVDHAISNPSSSLVPQNIIQEPGLPGVRYLSPLGGRDRVNCIRR